MGYSILFVGLKAVPLVAVIIGLGFLLKLGRK